MSSSRRVTALCCLLACSLLLGSIQVRAQDKPKDNKPEARQVDPLTGAAASAIGAAAGLQAAAATGGALKPPITASIVTNKLLAADSAGKALTDAGGIVGSLFASKVNGLAGVHAAAGKTLLDIVTAINSLNIAGTSFAVGVVDKKLETLLGGIRTEALKIGQIYTGLLGEFGRAVGAGLTAIETLGTGGLSFLNPIALGIDSLETSLTGLVNFLQGVTDITVSGPGRAAALAPFIGTLQAVNALLQALKAALLGPAGGLLGGLDGAIGAAGPLAGAANAVAGAVGGAVGGAGAGLGSTPAAAILVNKALDLIKGLL